MKKLLNFSFIYAIAGIAFGVFYREFTKFSGFTGRTTLGFTHLHLFVLGMFLFLILALFAKDSDLLEQKRFQRFLLLYNIALPAMVLLLTVRGVLQVLGTPLSNGINAAISGVSGLAHIVFTVAIVLLFLSLKALAQPKMSKDQAA